MSVAEAALDRAAEIIAAAIGVERVTRDQIMDEPAVDAVDETGLVVALATGAWLELGYATGASRPYEFQHDAPFEILVVRGDPAARRARRSKAIADANAAIAADPTLGGLVDRAEFVSPDPNDAERFLALAATLQLTFTAPDALG